MTRVETNATWIINNLRCAATADTRNLRSRKRSHGAVDVLLDCHEAVQLAASHDDKHPGSEAEEERKAKVQDDGEISEAPGQVEIRCVDKCDERDEHCNGVEHPARRHFSDAGVELWQSAAQMFLDLTDIPRFTHRCQCSPYKISPD